MAAGVTAGSTDPFAGYKTLGGGGPPNANAPNGMENGWFPTPKAPTNSLGLT